VRFSQHSATSARFVQQDCDAIGMAAGRLRKLRLGGVHEDGLFGVLPGWVDGSKAPGTTSQTSELGFGATMRNIVTLRCDRTPCCDRVHALATGPPWLATARRLSPVWR
tara:strand:+ start:277 stop:603 length:327 start_codon:yes stop_codon:yes gene_type:complete